MAGAIFLITGRTRSISSLGEIDFAPGRVDSPRTWMSAAPLRAISTPCLTAASVAKNSPPSEKESGVTLRTPMSSARLVRSMTFPSTLQRVAFITVQTITAAALFDRAPWRPRSPAGRRHTKWRFQSQPFPRCFAAQNDKAKRSQIPNPLAYARAEIPAARPDRVRPRTRIQERESKSREGSAERARALRRDRAHPQESL